MVTYRGRARGRRLQAMVAGADGARVRIGIPEIADYEVRRELLRAGKVRGIERLDAVLETFEYLPLSTAVMRDAALLWADVRRRGLPTADPKALDADVILAAQARRVDAAEVVIATTNVQNLSRLAEARLWQESRRRITRFVERVGRPRRGGSAIR